MRENDTTRHLGDVAAFARSEEIGLVDLVVVTMKTTANALLAIAGGGITTDRILEDPALAVQVRQLMDEIAAVARHLGHRISEEFIQSQIDATLGMGAYRPSSLVDSLAGREVDVEAIWGEPLRRAQAVGVATPRLAVLYADIKRKTSR